MIIPSDCIEHNAAARTLRLLDPYDNINANQIYFIRNLTKDRNVYNSRKTSTIDPSITIVDGVLTYTYDTISFDNDDIFQIVVDFIVIDGGTA